MHSRVVGENPETQTQVSASLGMRWKRIVREVARGVFGPQSHMSSNTYWLISAPSEGNTMFQTLQGFNQGLSINNVLTIPKLRAGTLDSLMTLSDDLAKHDQQVESVLRKLERQMNEFGETDFTIQVERKTSAFSILVVLQFFFVPTRHPGFCPFLFV
jgi:hypothetical protein